MDKERERERYSINEVSNLSKILDNLQPQRKREEVAGLTLSLRYSLV